MKKLLFIFLFLTSCFDKSDDPATSSGTTFVTNKNTNMSTRLYPSNKNVNFFTAQNDASEEVQGIVISYRFSHPTYMNYQYEQIKNLNFGSDKKAQALFTPNTKNTAIRISELVSMMHFKMDEPVPVPGKYEMNMFTTTFVNFGNTVYGVGTPLQEKSDGYPEFWIHNTNGIYPVDVDQSGNTTTTQGILVTPQSGQDFNFYSKGLTNATNWIVGHPSYFNFSKLPAEDIKRYSGIKRLPSEAAFTFRIDMSSFAVYRKGNASFSVSANRGVVFSKNYIQSNAYTSNTYNSAFYKDIIAQVYTNKREVRTIKFPDNVDRKVWYIVVNIDMDKACNMNIKTLSNNYGDRIIDKGELAPNARILDGYPFIGVQVEAHQHKFEKIEDRCIF